MSNFVDTIKQFYSQGYQRVYDEGQPLEILQKKWSFHIHGLGIEPAEALDENSVDSYVHTLRFAFNLERMMGNDGIHITDVMYDTIMARDDYRVPKEVITESLWESYGCAEYEIPEDIDLRYVGIEEGIFQLPDSVEESYRFYHKNVTHEDWGNAYKFRITIEGQDTFIIRVTTDGSDGWLEVFDTKGNNLASARTSGIGIAWQPSSQVREYVFGKPSFPPELE